MHQARESSDGGLARTRDRIERRIAELTRLYCSAQETGMPDDVLGPAVTEQALVSGEGGKRLRALLLLDAFDAASPAGTDSPAARGALDIACGIEVFQTAALIHDDIIDEADVRRGRPAAHRALGSFTRSSFQDVDDARARALGSGLGIMLGDLMATASVSIINAAVGTLPNRGRIMDRFLAMHRDVEVGQVLDLAAEHLGLDDPDALAKGSLAVFRWKTASYTTIAPIELALLAAGLDEDVCHDAALRIGTPLGIAFQLADDLLDVVADTASTGKPVGGDIREGKRTVLLADALAGSDADDAAYLRGRFAASHRSDDDVRRIIGLFVSTGAVERSRERIIALWHEANEGIVSCADALGLDERGLAALVTACSRFIPSDLRVEISPASRGGSRDGRR
ncbi:polyprenyl synthetase family protein [Bifidobacterium saimiriisciurei]